LPHGDLLGPFGQVLGAEQLTADRAGEDLERRSEETG
jgi:hypothetical protein